MLVALGYVVDAQYVSEVMGIFGDFDTSKIYLGGFKRLFGYFDDLRPSSGGNKGNTTAGWCSSQKHGWRGVSPPSLEHARDLQRGSKSPETKLAQDLLAAELLANTSTIQLAPPPLPPVEKIDPPENEKTIEDVEENIVLRV